MAQAGDEWELCKENVQPLREGRAMSRLQEVLSQQDCLNHHAIHQQKQAFELELRFYTGDDPLDVWDRYIKWAQQAFPQGGKESNLSPLLERAVKMFHLEKQYYNDIRYLNICLKFAHFCTEPVDLYSYLYSQGIGVQHAQLYITWAEEYETRGNYKKADSIFQDGVQCRAEPQEKLEAHHKQFQARVSRQILQGISDEVDLENPEASEPQRNSLVDLKARGKNKARAPVTRVGESIKSRNPSFFGPTAPPQQISSQSRFAVYDENASSSVPEFQLPLAAQPWSALPSSGSKENEQKAGPWNSLRQSRGPHQTSSHDPALNCPNFIPYVDQLTEPQTVTPCKINPSVTSVLSARKPGKEEDPLQRLQSICQVKKEMVMYCKNKIFAGVEEFCFEEIRAEHHAVKLRKENEEYVLASTLRREAMERQIEEMEKKLKALSTDNHEHLAVETGQAEECIGKTRTMEHLSNCKHDKMAITVSVRDENTMDTVVPVPLSTKSLQLAQHTPCMTEFNLPSPLFFEPFTIYDETFDKQMGTSPSRVPPPSRQPFAVHEDVPTLANPLDGTEPLNEEAIVSGSARNKTLSANPEDTCDFVRAAQLASTPFQKSWGQSDESNMSNLARFPLGEKTPVCEESFQQVFHLKKLSPILEASREDTPFSGSSVSVISARSTSLLAAFPMVLCERIELHRNLVAPISELLTSEQIHLEAIQMPHLKEEAEVQLGIQKYKLKTETVLRENCRIFTGVCSDTPEENMNGVVIKVDSDPVPWDFYITQQLKNRLGEEFESNFLRFSDCYLFQNGYITLYKDVNCFTVQDILMDQRTVMESVVILLAFNLLSLIEKLHSVDIIHGDLKPETLLLDKKIFDLSCTEMNGYIKPTDFSYSMDMRLYPTVTSRFFPVSQTEYGHQILGNQSSPYQVDLLGIANIIHFMIFAKSLQIHKEDSSWKINREAPRFWRRDLWSVFFSKILNTNQESSGCVLKELKDEMLQLFDSRIQDELCSYFIFLENQLNLL